MTPYYSMKRPPRRRDSRCHNCGWVHMVGCGLPSVDRMARAIHAMTCLAVTDAPLDPCGADIDEAERIVTAYESAA